jgi:hypothetical protein
MGLMQLISGKNKSKGFVSPDDSGYEHLDGTSQISLELDALLSESPEYSATPTKTQVEDGSDVTDHVALDPERLSIEAIVTNTPVGWDKVLTGQQFQNKAESAHEFLLNLYRSREPFDFVGSLGVYTDMILTKYNPSRDSKTGSALHFTASLEQIIIVESATVATSGISKLDSSVNHTASKTENSGQQATKEASDKSKTIAASLNDKYHFLPGLVSQ